MDGLTMGGLTWLADGALMAGVTDGARLGGSIASGASAARAAARRLLGLEALRAAETMLGLAEMHLGLADVPEARLGYHRCELARIRGAAVARERALRGPGWKFGPV